jgi:hypothetical protein
VCLNLYEVCSSCEQASSRLRGCVEDKSLGFHDNGGYLRDVLETKGETGSWIKEKSSEQGDEK